nr:uncharacterized protein LOC115260043 [Aedes albopictus]
MRKKQRTIPLVSEDDMPDTLQVTVINQPVHEDHHQPVIRLEKKDQKVVQDMSLEDISSTDEEDVCEMGDTNDQIEQTDEAVSDGSASASEAEENPEFEPFNDYGQETKEELTGSDNTTVIHIYISYLK